MSSCKINSSFQSKTPEKEAPPVLINGICGESHDQGFSKEPSTHLCSSGVVSNFSYINKKWTWSCNGNNSGTNTNCEALTNMNHILIAGQSLSIGPLPATSTIQNFSNNFMLSEDAYPGPRGTAKPLVPLEEVSRESPASGIGNSIVGIDIDRVLATTAHGRGGSEYGIIKKNGSFGVYASGMIQAQNVKDESELMGYKYNPIAVVLIHGERDQKIGNGNIYDTFLYEFQNNYELDLNSTAGTDHNIPMFINQTSAVGPHETALSQLKAHKNDSEVYLIGPLYQYRYDDGIHINNEASKHLGEQFAKVIDIVVFKKENWNPLMPTNFQLVNNKLTIQYHVPKPPLVFDTTIVADRTSASIGMKYGFQFYDNGVLIDITDIIIKSDTSIEITLNSAPTSNNKVIKYSARSDLANTHSGGSNNKDFHGGNLRDSDNTISQSFNSTNLPLYNWAVSFSEIID